MASSEGRHFKQSKGDNEAPHTSDAASNDAPSDKTEGFIPVVSEDDSSKKRRRGKNRRIKSDNYRETDPYDLSGKRSRDPKKRRNRVISTALFVVGIALLAIAAGMFIRTQIQYYEQDQENEKLAQYATVDDTGTNPPEIDWASLKAINSDVVGWVQIPNTVVSFPVYQGSDNETYLHTNAEGNYSLGGQVFLDYQNAAPGMVDQQSIIYGHHLRNGAMFKPIADMDNQEAFDSISTIWYVTEDQTYELEPLLVYYTTEDDENVRIFDWSTEEEFHAYLNDLLAKSVTSRSDAAELIPKTEHVLTLCTCNYIEGYGRTILVCVVKDEVNE